MTALRNSFARGAIVVLATLTVALAFAVEASAQSQLGQIAPEGTTNSPCVGCSFLQFSDDGSPSYRASEQSVITRFSFREGSTFGLNNSFSLQVWRPVGPIAHQLVAESQPLATAGVLNYEASGYVRMSMRAGDVLGIRINTSGGDTSPTHPAPSGNMLGAIVGNPSVGQTFSPATTNSLRLNLSATIEPDADGDGFGDETQDLCVGNASAGNTACSGTLVGPELTDPIAGGAFSGATGALFVPTGVPSGTATSPIDGVIVRWRYKTVASAGNHRLRVVKLTGAASGQPIRSSEPVPSPGGTIRIVRSGEVRIPINAGDAIGLEVPPNSYASFLTWPGMSGLKFFGAPPDGGTATADDVWPASAPTVSADVEPDADGDGFGDITQDKCPGNGAVSDVCPPTLAAVKSSNSKFRVNTKGAVISAAKRGTTLSYTLGGAAATVKVTVQRVVKGRRSGKKCVKPGRRNKRKKVCNRYVKVHEFSRDAALGSNIVAYSGRYKSGGRNRKLALGRYRFSLTATNASGDATAVSKAVRVVKR